MTKARDIASAIPAPSTVSSAELGFLDGVTSAIQTQVDAKIAKTLTTTTGDIIYASGANTPARLGIGSTDQVLKVTGGVPAWATPASGSMTLLASGTFSSSALSLTSISGSYINLVLIFENYVKSGGTDTNFRLNSDSGSNYAWAQYATGLTSFNTSTSNTTLQTNQPGFNSAPGSLYMTIYNYSNTNSHKAVTSLFNGNAGGNKNAVWNIGTYASTSAITGILTTDAMTSGSYYLYGVK